MSRAPLLAALLLTSIIPTASAESRARIVALDISPLQSAQSLVWVAAHADDEVIVAPLLASLCVERRGKCTVIILTRGEKGVCLLSGGCDPSLSAVRSAEAGLSSQYFGADLVLLNLADGGGGDNGLAGGWEEEMGGREPLLRMLAAYIAAAGADAVLTYDPRHGTTCHGDHRAVGRLVGEALARIAEPPPLYYVETRIDVNPEGPAISFAPAGPMAPGFAFDANRELAGLGHSGWDALIRAMRIHRSQFDEGWIQAARAVPHNRRAVWVVPAGVALEMEVSSCH
ncbi:MAG TPA: PIG-L family deacetylase [Thermoanaerobaculia bacterium]|nr:PIG-L family deacetylase [Thermoanaerobaculia bacterium]